MKMLSVLEKLYFVPVTLFCLYFIIILFYCYYLFIIVLFVYEKQATLEFVFLICVGWNSSQITSC
jgi:hypothetical protein